MPGQGRSLFRRLGFFVVVLSVVSCAGPQVRVPTGGQVGKASWYGRKFHGRRTASGEVYNMYQITAAHRTLPLGTWVHVTNLENGRSIEVRINDRGPFVRGRIIDLSYGAARAIGMVRQGVVRVHVFPLGSRPRRVTREKGDFWDSRAGPGYTLQVGSFSDEGNAISLKNRLDGVTSDIYISKVSVGGETFYRVRIGNFASQAAARRAAGKVAAKGFTVILIEPD